MKFADLSVKDRQEIIRRVQAENGLHLQIIEKDWWVTAVLRALFALPYADIFCSMHSSKLSQTAPTNMPCVRPEILLGGMSESICVLMEVETS